jgi:hypothetical protein
MKIQKIFGLLFLGSFKGSGDIFETILWLGA